MPSGDRDEPRTAPRVAPVTDHLADPAGSDAGRSTTPGDGRGVSVPDVDVPRRPPSPGERVGIYANTAADLLYRKGPIRYRPEPSTADPARLHAILEGYDDEVAFTHVGLSDVGTAFETRPYEFLLEAFDDHFRSVLAPGYTPQFRERGVHDVRASEPAYGAWSRRFLDDADYRTADPIHSILVRGPYRFDDCALRNTFASDGCFAKLDRDDVLVVNVGTRWLMTTQHHYVEYRHDVPYQEETRHEGTLVHEDGERERIVQRNHTYTLPARRAHRKLQRRAVDAGVVDEYELGGVLVLAFNAREYHEFLADRLRTDPYFLISAW